MSELARLLKKPIVVEIEGEPLRFSRPTDRLRLQLEEWVEKLEEDLYWRSLALCVEPEQKRALSDAYIRRVQGHDFAFGKPGFMARINTLEGAVEVAWVFLKENYDDLTRDEVFQLMTQYAGPMGEALTLVLADGQKGGPAGAGPPRGPVGGAAAGVGVPVARDDLDPARNPRDGRSGEGTASQAIAWPGRQAD
jgi:hypothetical protein